MIKTIVNQYTFELAKKQTLLALKKCRQTILGVIKNWCNKEEKQKLIDKMNENINPLTEDELNYIKK